MVESLLTPFVEYGFMRRALVGCVALSVAAPAVGVFLMLRRMSLTGDAMAHAILPGAAVGYLISGLSLGAMTVGGIVAGLIVALCASLVARVTVQREDASLAAFYLISLALGVLIVSSRGSSVDLMHVLFGTVLALNDEAILLIASVASLTLVVLALLYRPLVVECLDPGFLASVSRLGPVVHHAFMILVVLNLVAGFHALGTLMAVGILILPAAAARFWAHDVNTLILVAVAVAMGSCVVGLLVSYHFGVATGPSIILTAGVCYVISVLVAPSGVVTRRVLTARHYEA